MVVADYNISGVCFRNHLNPIKILKCCILHRKRCKIQRSLFDFGIFQVSPQGGAIYSEQLGRPGFVVVNPA